MRESLFEKRDGKIIEPGGFSKFVPRSVNRGGLGISGTGEEGRGAPPSAMRRSWRSAANGADSIIIIKFNWHATPWPIVAVALNGLDFLPGCFPSDRFCFAPRTPAASTRSFTGNGIASLSKMNFPPCTHNFALFVLIN